MSHIPNKKRDNIVLVAFIAVLTAIVIIYSVVKNSDLKTNGIVLNNAVVTEDIITAHSTTLNLRYHFSFQGKQYVDDATVKLSFSHHFIGRAFPIRFSPKTGRSELMVTPEDFKKYGLSYPDSLLWLKPYWLD